MQRRQILSLGSAWATATLTGCGGGTNDAAPDMLASSVDRSAALANAAAPPPNRRTATPPSRPRNQARVLVLGGGMAGATAAKYLRLWGDQVAVTLVDRSPTYTSNIMSSLVLTGQRTLASLRYDLGAQANRYGFQTQFGEVTDIDPVATRVRLASGAWLGADRLVLAPGIAFDAVPGLNNPDAMPHAWQAGPQTSLLASQLAALPTAGVVVLTIPKAPYRCPPGPYERACLLADWLKRNKPGARLIVLDANPDFVTEVDNFSRAFYDLHASVIEYRTNVVIDHVDEATRTLYTNTGTVRGDVVNLIPTQRAPDLLARAGLLNDASGRFAKVNVLDYASTAAPTVHVIGDASATTQPKAGHIANQEAKVLADALSRILAGGSPDPAPVTNSACFSTITMSQASWLHAVYQYDPASASMKAVPAATGASNGWNGDGFDDMGRWFKALMADSYA